MKDYRVQSVLFDSSMYSTDKAEEWLKIHNMKNKGVDIKDKHLRYRQLNPTYLRRLGYTEYRTVDITKGIMFIIVYHRTTK